MTRYFAARFPARWLALGLVDGDPGVEELLAQAEGGDRVAAVAAQARERLTEALGPSAITAVAAARYQWINDVVAEVVDRSGTDGPTRTDKIDAVITNRWLGVPIFLAAMWIVFKLTPDVAAVFLDWIDGAVSGPVSRLATRMLGALGI